FAFENDRHSDNKLLVHGDALQIDVQQRALDRLILPVHDHGLGFFAIEGQIKNSVVTSLRVKDGLHLPWINRNRQSIFACAINHRRDFAVTPHTPRSVLISRSARLRLQHIARGCSRHNLFLYKNNLLTEVSSWMDWIARPSRPAIVSFSIFGSRTAASLKGIVFVSTTLVRHDLEI